MPILDIGGSGVYYTVKGEGTPIVFIHPPLITSVNFRYQIEELSRKFKVITFDVRGHGRSAYSETPVTYQLITNDIRNLLDYLKIDKTYLCGYSTGGSVVLEFLLANQDRAIGGIIVSGMSEIRDFLNQKLITLATILSKIGAIRLLGLAISFDNSDSKKTFDNLFQEALKGDKRNIEQYFRYSLTYNCTSQLDTIYLPVLLVFGTKDKYFHQYAKILHEKLPRSELELISEKHQIPTKSAQELNQLISRFICKQE